LIFNREHWMNNSMQKTQDPTQQRRSSSKTPRPYKGVNQSNAFHQNVTV